MGLIPDSIACIFPFVLYSFQESVFLFFFSFSHSHFDLCALRLQLKQIPSGMARAPVRMEWDMGEPAVEDYEFYGGLAAMHQHADGALEVRTGWAVVEA